ncbi:MAG: hypothetical protein ACMXYG_03210 [Candidatus Woesearchaeota archaeon]
MFFINNNKIKTEWNQFILYKKYFKKKVKNFSEWNELIKKNKINNIYTIVSNIILCLENELKQLDTEIKNKSNINNSNSSGIYNLLVQYIKILNNLRSNIEKQDNIIKNLKWSIYTKIPNLKELLNEEDRLLKSEESVLLRLKMVHMAPNIDKASLTRFLLKHNLLTDYIKKIIDDVMILHQNQKRDGGSGYINEHIFPVTVDVITYFLKSKKMVEEEIIATTLLHDSLEDTSISDTEFIKKYGSKVYEMVKVLTKNSWEEYHGDNTSIKKSLRDQDYFNMLGNSNKDLLIIKFHDRLNNLLTLPQCTDEKIKEYIFKTEKYILPLAKNYSIYHYKKMNKLIEKIKKIVK